MISRLTALATTVGLIAAVSLGVAANVQAGAVSAVPVAAKPAQILQLPTIVVVAKRTAQ